MDNPLWQLAERGQSVWLDDLRRDFLGSGRLERWMEDDGVRGVTSNPAIFEKAIAQSGLYDGAIRELARPGRPVEEVYEALVVEDIRRACDLFRPVYEETGGADGFVSLEVSPHLAHDTQGTIAEAERLWERVDRPNLMIKVPATPAGLAAVEALIAQGLNVNVTLIFSQAAYEAASEAYIRGLERRLETGWPVEGVASVASAFISRVDSLVDGLLEERAAAEPELRGRVEDLLGRTGIANAKLIYRRYREIFHGPRFARLAEAGAARQRPLWASTSTKNPAYSDVLYVESLIGPETVNTMPPVTLEAFRDHGTVRGTLEEDLDGAREVLGRIRELGIDLDAAMDRLLLEGVRKFIEPFDRLLEGIRRKRASPEAT